MVDGLDENTSMEIDDELEIETDMEPEVVSSIGSKRLERI